MTQAAAPDIVKSDTALTLTVAPAALRRKGISWMQYHSYPEPDLSFRRLAMPWACIIVNFGCPSWWRPPGGDWRAFPRLALKGPATRWSEGCDAAGMPLEYASVLIEPWAVETLLGIPARCFQDDIVALDSVWGGLAATLLDRLDHAPEPRQRLATIAAFLMDRLVDAPAPDPRIAAFMRLTRQQSGAPSLVHHCQAMRERSFRKRFKQAVGVSPKQWAILERFAAAAREKHPNSWGDWSDTAPADYFDQAHAIRDFVRYSGITPSAYRRAKANGDARIFMVTM